MVTTSLMEPTSKVTTDKHQTVPIMTIGVQPNKEILIPLKMAPELKTIQRKPTITVLAKPSTLGRKEDSIISTVMEIRYMFLKEETGNK